MWNIQTNEVPKDKLENSPEKVEELQEELELEKLKKEIITSLYNDWIYEYKVKEKKIITISGNGSTYHIAGEKEPGQQYMLSDNLHVDDRQAFIKCYQGISGSNESGYVEARVMVDGEYYWISLTTRVLRNRAGEVVSVIGKISDINAKKKEELNLKIRAMQDSMTGLLNRSAFYKESEKWLEAASKEVRRNPALLIVDIDNFREINDTYGHLYGDTVIVSMADTLKRVF